MRRRVPPGRRGIDLVRQRPRTTARAQPRGGCWPTSGQRLLLRAALLSGPPALEAFERWRRSIPAGGLDRGSSRLLPLLAWNLRRHGVRDPLPAELADGGGAVRQTNVLLLERLGRLLEAFAGAGLDTMVLKGAAMIARYYPDPGLRPMSDVDVLVRTDDALAAMTLLRRLGWAPELAVPERVVPVTHSHPFRDARAVRLDLHWHLCWEACGARADDDFWAASVAVAVDGAPTAALCHADQLLHACVHGVAWNPIPPLRWAADAAWILQAAGPALAWGRIVAQARRLRLVLPTEAALRFLQDALDAPVPDAVLAALRASPVSRLERFEYRARMRPWRWYGALPRLVGHYLRLSRATGQRASVRGFAGYLRQLHGLAGVGELPAALSARLLGRAWSR